MGLFWAVLGAVVAAGLVVMALLDRRARRQGHRLRGSGSMSVSIRAFRRQVRGESHTVNRGFHGEASDLTTPPDSDDRSRHPED